MPGLLRDRYFEYAPNRAWDLVTGETVSAQIEEGQPHASDPASGPLIELLDHGIDGMPRWIVSGAGGVEWRKEIHRAAREARHRGYVPIAVEIFLRTRLLLAEHLRTRALLLIARPDLSIDSMRMALLHAAAISQGPHVLLEMAHSRGEGHEMRWRAAEARVSYGATRSRTAAPVPAPPAPPDVIRLLERARRAADFVQSGRHAAAERLLRETAAALGRRRAGVAAAETYMALGQLLLERGRVAAADTAFEEAAVHAESVDVRLVGRARVWQAAGRTDAGQLTAAESLCRAVLVASAVEEVRQLAEATLGRVLLWQGRLAEAAALPFVRQTTALANPQGSPHVFVAATAVRLLVETGDLFEAGRRARALLDATGGGDHAARVIALGAHLRVLLATGDLTLAREQLGVFEAATRAARTPLRLARMRLAWSHALRRAGRASEADRERRSLARMRSVLPPLLQSAVDRRVTPPAPPPAGATCAAAVPAGAAELVTLAHKESDDADALKRIGTFVLQGVRASRVEFWTSDEGPATPVVTSGAGLTTRLGPRALEAGTVIGPESAESGWEMAVPVRLGSRLIGALCARWPADRSPGDALTLLNLASAVAAPRVESLSHDVRAVAQAATAIPELVGVSAAIGEVRRAVLRAAAAPFSVLIEGESGVGKELVARAIHHLSPRRSRRFCDVNCAAVPDDLFESELFGHARGAFSGAVHDRAGLVEEADGGTLFLDEVADLSARAQAKLLRVVQQQEVRRVGETFSRKVDVRFVSAANRDLRREGEEGRFRQDLLYRLEVIRIRIPPLRERPEDVAPLVRHFWTAASARVNTAATLSHGVLAALARYHWPGNVRELQNVMAALAVEAPTRGQVRASLLPAVITGATTVTAARLSTARLQWERRFVEVALARAGGNRSRAARDLGLTRQGLLKALERLGLASLS
ncbi:MAG TPA: sigma 54-interacting transcriptional regulator [Vicinamibacterales bacterium]|nr:sigma 54-interacting transcriptional regulator [Vicinamibacterales bacterium]